MSELLSEGQSLSLDKKQLQYTDYTDNAEFSVKNQKIRSIREIRVQKSLNPRF